MGTYWPELTPLNRRNQLYKIWERILELLEQQLEGVSTALPIPEINAPRSELKAYEDALDATVCAWIATRALDGFVDRYGDEQSAIWIPNNNYTT